MNSNTDLLDRARAFAKRTAKETALRIAPLAIVAISARADVPFSPGDFFYFNPGVNSMTSVDPTVTQPGGDVLYTNGVVEYDVSGGGVVSGMGFEADESYNDSNYSGGDPVMVTYNFNIESTKADVESWFLEFKGPNGSELVVDGSGAGDFQGSAEPLLIPGNESGGGWSVDFRLSANFPNADTGRLTIDLNELKFSSPAPEPGTFLTIPAGLGFLLWRRRRKA